MKLLFSLTTFSNCVLTPAAYFSVGHEGGPRPWRRVQVSTAMERDARVSSCCCRMCVCGVGGSSGGGVENDTVLLMVQEFCHLPHKFQSSLKHKGDVRQVNYQ